LGLERLILVRRVVLEPPKVVLIGRELVDALLHGFTPTRQVVHAAFIDVSVLPAPHSQLIMQAPPFQGVWVMGHSGRHVC